MMFRTIIVHINLEPERYDSAPSTVASQALFENRSCSGSTNQSPQDIDKIGILMMGFFLYIYVARGTVVSFYWLNTEHIRATPLSPLRRTLAELSSGRLQFGPAFCRDFIPRIASLSCGVWFPPVDIILARLSKSAQACPRNMACSTALALRHFIYPAVRAVTSILISNRDIMPAVLLWESTDAGYFVEICSC